MKNISIWFNSYGVDECLGKIKGEYSVEVLNKIVEWNEVMWKGLYEEGRGEGWVMYGYDGYGVFVVNEGYSEGKCKEEYDKMMDVI